MINTDTPFSKEIINNTISAYSKETRFILSYCEPMKENSTNHRLKIYYKKYLRIVTVNSIQEFLDILHMYEELEKD